MRRITNYLAPLLEFYRYINKHNPYTAFNKLSKTAVFPKAVKGNVLLVPVRVSPVSNLFEGLIGYALRLRGYNVSALMCGQSLERCDNINQDAPFSLGCSLCNLEQKKFADTFSVIPEYFSELINDERKLKLKELSTTVPIGEIFSYVHEGVPIGEHVESGVARYLLSSTINIQKHQKIIRQFFYASLVTADATRACLRKVKPEFVILSHGIYSTWGAVLETCKTDNYRTIVWGRGYIGQGNILVGRNSSYIYETITEDISVWKNNIVSPETKKELEHYFVTKRNPDSGTDHVNYYQGITRERKNIIRALNLDESRKRIGVYPNIPWDGKTFSATEEFPDMNAFVRAILEWAQINKHVDIIIRAHPAETARKKNLTSEGFLDILKSECTDLPSNIKFIPPNSNISSYQLFKVCDAALMYSSTLALEFAFAHHPVIQVGLNNVSNKDLIFDAPTKAKMFELLSKAINGELIISERMKDNISKYADYWVNHRHMPETLMELSHLNFVKYKFSDVRELQELNNKTLDWFIDCCINDKPFVIQ